MYLLEGDLPHNIDKSKAGLLSFSGEDTSGYKVVEVLSHDKNLRTCAVNLFAAIHRLEEANIDYILAETIPEKGIGIAIMDRLRKAAYKHRPIK